MAPAIAKRNHHEAVPAQHLPARRRAAAARGPGARSCGTSTRCSEEMKAAGAWVFAGGLHAAEHRHGRARQGRRRAHDRRPVRRGQGAHRRVHDHQGRRISTPRSSGAASSPRRPRCRSRCGRSRRRSTDPTWHASTSRSNVSSARSTAARSPSWSASSATSTSPRRRSRTRSPRRCSAGRRRRAAEPGGLDHHHRPQPRDRPAAPRGVARRPPRAGGAAARAATSRAEEEDAVRDDRLRLIFTCCHPALAPSARSR